ncbi:hypothetical protein L0337_27595 [candidate division KSB1 bacterium]|nr:hypothetical protein [candidate division KSB1 bacterium]
MTELILDLFASFKQPLQQRFRLLWLDFQDRRNRTRKAGIPAGLPQAG